MGDVQPGAPGDVTYQAPRIPRSSDLAASFSCRLLLVVIVPVIVAAMFTTVPGPCAQWLRRHGWPPLLATWAVLLGALAVVDAIMSWLVPAVSNEVTSLSD